MDMRKLGRTNLFATEIGVGCWAAGGPFSNLGVGGGWDGISNDEVKQGLITSIKMGANLFDTADVYGHGNSERFLGWMIKNILNKYNKSRKDIVLVSKVGYFKGCALHGYDPLHIKHQLEMSLKNLQTRYLDVYFFHHLNFGKDDEYLEGAIDQMKYYKDAGLIRFLGLRGPHKYSVFRNVVDDHLEDPYNKFLRLAKKINPDVISLRYNMISPTYDTPEKDIFEWAENHDVGILIYKPLGQGLLLNKYDPKNPPSFSLGDNRSRKLWFKEKGLNILKSRLDKIGSRFDCTTTKDFVQLALKYCLSRSKSACVLVGFRNSKQIRESLSTIGYLEKDDCDYIREVFSGINNEIGSFIETGE